MQVCMRPPKLCVMLQVWISKRRSRSRAFLLGCTGARVCAGETAHNCFRRLLPGLFCAPHPLFMHCLVILCSCVLVFTDSGDALSVTARWATILMCAAREVRNADGRFGAAVSAAQEDVLKQLRQQGRVKTHAQGIVSP